MEFSGCARLKAGWQSCSGHCGWFSPLGSHPCQPGWMTTPLPQTWADHVTVTWPRCHHADPAHFVGMADILRMGFANPILVPFSQTNFVAEQKKHFRVVFPPGVPTSVWRWLGRTRRRHAQGSPDASWRHTRRSSAHGHTIGGNSRRLDRLRTKTVRSIRGPSWPVCLLGQVRTFLLAFSFVFGACWPISQDKFKNKWMNFYSRILPKSFILFLLSFCVLCVKKNLLFSAVSFSRQNNVPRKCNEWLIFSNFPLTFCYVCVGKIIKTFGRYVQNFVCQIYHCHHFEVCCVSGDFSVVALCIPCWGCRYCLSVLPSARKKERHTTKCPAIFFLVLCASSVCLFMAEYYHE